MQTKWMGTISRMESRSQKKAAVQECYSQIHLLFIFFAVDRRGAYARPTQPFGATLGCASSPGNHFLKHTALTCASFLAKPSPLRQSLLSFMNSSTSSNKIEPPIDIFNRFLFLSLLGCQHLSLSRAEADVAVSGCVEKLFEKNLFHASIVPHVFALMQNKALLSQSISQSLSSVDSFLAATDLSWNAGLWADSHFYGRAPAEIVIQLCFRGTQKIIGRKTDLKTAKSIELSFWERLVQINTRCLDTPFKLVSDKAGVDRLDHSYLLDQRAVRQAAQKISDSRNSKKRPTAAHTQPGQTPKVVGAVRPRAQGVKALDLHVDVASTTPTLPDTQNTPSRGLGGSGSP